MLGTTFRGLAMSMALGTVVACTANTPFKVEKTIKAPDGSYDYASVDSRSQRLFVGRGYGVMVVDLVSAKSHTLMRNSGVAAVLVIPGTNLLLTTNSNANTASLIDSGSGAVKATIPTGRDPDGAFYDVGSGRAFVMNGDSEDVTIIDVARARSEGRVRVGGKPEAAVTDGKSRLFVNIEDRNVIAVIDVAARRVVDEYKLQGCNEPTGLAYDAISGMLIAACHNNMARIVDARTGASKGRIPIGAGADGSLFDAKSRIGFIPCIDGTLTAYRLDREGRATVVQTLKTREGARTAAHDSRTGKLYLPAATVNWSASKEYLGATKGFSVLVVGR